MKRPSLPALPQDFSLGFNIGFIVGLLVALVVMAIH